ncbi:hypothetical protein DFJ73DRAFT_848111 [Zopfochytrium polystomum]|nr:hypothetical protein DFJ73DRAFT_848111 [Zopfochytrium polystomum]
MRATEQPLLLLLLLQLLFFLFLLPSSLMPLVLLLRSKPRCLFGVVVVRRMCAIEGCGGGKRKRGKRGSFFDKQRSLPGQNSQTTDKAARPRLAERQTRQTDSR